VPYQPFPTFQVIVQAWQPAAPLPQLGYRQHRDEIALPSNDGVGDVNLGDPDNIGGQPSFDWLTVSGSDQPPLVLPLFQVSGTAYSGETADGVVTLPLFDANGTGLAGCVGDGAVTLPLFDVGGTDANVFSLPLFTVAGTGVSGTVGGGAFVLPDFDVVGTVISQNLGDGALNLPLFTVVGVGQNLGVNYGIVTLPKFSVSGVAEAGGVGTAALTLPLLQVSGAGAQNNVGTASFSLPLLQISGLVSTVIAAPVVTGVVVNSTTKAASTYSGINFNSVALFNGVILAATKDGIFALSGATDVGVPIVATVKGGLTDFGTEQQPEERLKRVLAAYVGYRATGEWELSVITDERDTYVYRLAPRQQGQIHPARVKLAHGAKGRYVQWQLKNINGAGGTFDKLTLDADVLSRRVG
jgi:hypothetical protein